VKTKEEQRGTKYIKIQATLTVWHLKYSKKTQVILASTSQVQATG
jgi:hypothetical protein